MSIEICSDIHNWVFYVDTNQTFWELSIKSNLTYKYNLLTAATELTEVVFACGLQYSFSWILFSLIIMFECSRATKVQALSSSQA